MINIKKGNHTLKVSRDTYESMFKIMGYTIVDEKEEANKKASSNKAKENTKKQNDNKELDDLLNNTNNLSNEKENKIKNDSDEKDNNLENIIGMLSKENAKKK